ncbi:hypothetical protein D3C79_1024900 [compost metagenome]
METQLKLLNTTTQIQLYPSCFIHAHNITNEGIQQPETSHYKQRQLRIIFIQDKKVKKQ